MTPAHNDARSENRKFPSDRLLFETPSDGRSQVGAVFQDRDVPPDPQAGPILGFRDDVEMHVPHGLVSRRPIILKYVEMSGPRGLEYRSTQPRQDAPDGRGRFIRQPIQRFSRFFWNHQRMAFGQRIDIQESQNVLIFIHAVTGNLTVQNFLKDRHGTQNKPNPSRGARQKFSIFPMANVPALLQVIDVGTIPYRWRQVNNRAKTGNKRMEPPFMA